MLIVTFIQTETDVALMEIDIDAALIEIDIGVTHKNRHRCDSYINGHRRDS